MASGNFIIGRDLSMQGFNEYIKPELEKHEIIITDIMLLNNHIEMFGNSIDKYILASMRGGKISDIEAMLRVSMDDAYEIVDEKFKEANTRGDYLSTWTWQLKSGGTLQCMPLGIYSNDETASKVYQNLAVKYSALDLEHQLEETEGAISDFASKFK